MACFALKPPSLSHLKLTDKQCMNFWLNYSESTNATFVRNQFENLRIAIKKGSIDYKGKRMFIAIGSGHVFNFFI